MELQNKVAIVTGATGGLGTRICNALAQRGSHIAVCYAESSVKAEELVKNISQYGGKAMTVQFDQSQEDSVKKMVGAVADRFGRIDMLINDAAHIKSVAFSDLANLHFEDWSKILGVNLNGPFLCCKAAAPLIKQGGGGRIVNIGSTAGLYPSGSSIAYCVSKAGLIHLTKCLAVALAPDILVNCVAPGFMEGTRTTAKLTEERKQAVIKESLLKRPVSKDDVARIVVDFCQTDSITGQTLVVDAGRYFN